MSQNISILQIEDSAEIQTGFRNVLAQVSNGTSAYLPQTANLGEFAARLRSDTAFSRFILDGRFPLSHEDPIGFYLPRALRLIQASQIKVDRIVIYSGEDMARLQGAIPKGLDREKIKIYEKSSNTGIQEALEAVFE